MRHGGVQSGSTPAPPRCQRGGRSAARWRRSQAAVPRQSAARSSSAKPSSRCSARTAKDTGDASGGRTLAPGYRDTPIISRRTLRERLRHQLLQRPANQMTAVEAAPNPAACRGRRCTANAHEALLTHQHTQPTLHVSHWRDRVQCRRGVNIGRTGRMFAITQTIASSLLLGLGEPCSAATIFGLCRHNSGFSGGRTTPSATILRPKATFRRSNGLVTAALHQACGRILLFRVLGDEPLNGALTFRPMPGRRVTVTICYTLNRSSCVRRICGARCAGRNADAFRDEDGSERWAQAGGLRLGRTGKVRSCGWRVNSVAVERTFARLRGKQVRRISPESFVISSTFLHPRAFALAGSPFASRPKTRISLPK